MNYSILPTVYDSGIAETGLTGIVNDRSTSLTVPWLAKDTEDKEIIWNVTSDNGKTYKLIIPTKIEVDEENKTTTVSYTKGTYSVEEVD